MNLESLLTKDTQVVAVVDNQFGDTGKGKVVDVFTEWADVVGRGTGGNNAGHTLVIDDKEIVLHLLNVAALYNKTCLLGNGMVINPYSLVNELEEVKKMGFDPNNLMISEDAHVIMPYHIARDQKNNQSLENGGIGSTGRGIGPCYADKIARKGIMIRDLFDKDIIVKKIKKALEHYPEQKLNIDETIDKIIVPAEKIRSYVRDTISEMHRFKREGKKILLEGAQGLLLSVEFGTYPYVTSSDPSLSGTAIGVGLSARDIDLPIGIIKYPFMTRVGGGPFPTEFGGYESEKHCAAGLEHDIFYEVKNYLGMDLDLGKVRKSQQENDFRELIKFEAEVRDYIKSHRNKIVNLMNDHNPFIQGVGIRLAAYEYGATTKRPRRNGWTDAESARYAQMINGTKIVLTKPDCLAGIDEFQICFGYKDKNDQNAGFDRDSNSLREIRPLYRRYKGYSDISKIDNYNDLPVSLKESIEDFEKYTDGKVIAVSNGPRKEEIILKNS
ncbi:MAG: adenylosuccinate synthetase [Nanoarchaeota archaeon]|nr:adenylosuccinate synthetase [Nanoarchaeota archaeon]MBU1632660.1 adenylosuccinate synthetase [Nanoarchaeota archaeon]MBU1875570.1 adenylosuccinate synthetase [Nanoarchaeota archaeon]